ncbi:DUF3817 domain-containing protein [Nocardia sp. NPDC003693]
MGAVNIFDLSTIAKRFRFVAVLEAVSWALLIVGMICKRLDEPIMWPVKVFGMFHGAVFVAFLIVALLAARELKWPWWVALLALASSIPPFFTVLFELWAAKSGLLGELSTGRRTEPASPAPARS